MGQFLRIIGILICLVLMLGFGLCGLIGVGAGVVGGIGALGIILGLVGVAISVGCFFAIRVMLNSSSNKDQPPLT